VRNPGSAAPRGFASEADLLARDYNVDIGGCLSHAWEIFKSNAGTIIGASVLVYLCIFASNMILSIIPYLSIVVASLITGPLMGGLWAFYIKSVRYDNPGIGDAFSGFGPKFWQLALVQLIPSLLMFAAILVFGLVAALGIPAAVAAEWRSRG